MTPCDWGLSSCFTAKLKLSEAAHGKYPSEQGDGQMSTRSHCARCFVSISSEVSCCVERLGMENRSCKLICDQQSQGAAETGNVGLPTSKSALWSALTTPSNSILYIMQAHYPCILYIKRRIAAHGRTIVHSFWRRQTEACRVWKWSKREQGCQKDGLVADESTSKTKWTFILRVWIPREASFLQLSLQT